MPINRAGNSPRLLEHIAASIGHRANLDPQNKNEEKSTTKSTKGTKGRSFSSPPSPSPALA
ncbi:hypothetical protein ACYULU_01040 [Breznakiellaceae bacterium SP9]